MAKTVMQELLVRFVGDTKELQQAANRANDSIRSVSGVAGMASTALRTFAGALSISAIANAARATMQWADDLGDLAQTLGLTTEKLQAMQYAAISNGSSVEEINSAMLRFTNAVGEAASAGGPLLDRFNELGISIVGANGQILGLSDLLPQAADAISQASTAQEKLNIATDFFGRSAAPSMVRMLGEGAGKLSELEQAARDAGAVLDEEMIRKSSEINGKWEILTHTIGVKFRGAIISSMDAVKALGAAIADVYDDNPFRSINDQRVFSQKEKDDFLKNVGIGGFSKEQREQFLKEVGAGPISKPAASASTNPVTVQRTGGYGQSVFPTPYDGGKDAYNQSVIKSNYNRAQAEKAAKEIERSVEKQRVTIEKMNNALQYEIELMNDLKDSAKDALGEFVRGVGQGKNAFESLRGVALNVLNDIASSMMNMAMGGSSGSGLGGLIAGGIGKIFGGVTATSGPAAGQVVFPKFDVGTQYVPRDMIAQVHRGEMIVPAAKAASMRSGDGGVTIMQTNNFQSGVSRSEVAAMLPEISKASVRAVQDAMARGAI